MLQVKNNQKSLKKSNESTKSSSRTSARKLNKKPANSDLTGASHPLKPGDSVVPPPSSNPEKVDANAPCGLLKSDGDKKSAKNTKDGTNWASEPNQNGKNKKMHRYEIDMSEMAESRAINAVEFKNYLVTRFKNDGKINNLANDVVIEQDDWNVIITSKVFFKKSVLKYHAKKFLKMKKLRAFIQIVGNQRMGYRFTYYKSQ